MFSPVSAALSEVSYAKGKDVRIH